MIVFTDLGSFHGRLSRTTQCLRNNAKGGTANRLAGYTPFSNADLGLHECTSGLSRQTPLITPGHHVVTAHGLGFAYPAAHHAVSPTDVAMPRPANNQQG